MKKLLFLPGYYKPEHAASSYLWENIEEAYIQAGFELTVYAPVPTRGISEEIRLEYRRKLYEEEYGGQLTIHRFRMIREKKNTLQRALRYTLCLIRQTVNGCKEKNVDIYFISSTPPINALMFPFFHLFHRKRKILYNLQDIFPDSLVNTGLTQEGSALWKIGRIIEKIAYRYADHIVVPSEDYKKNIMKKGVAGDRVMVIRNWVDENAVVGIDREKNDLFDQYGLDRSKFYITYCGNIGFSQNMDLLLDTAAELKEHDNIRFVLIGDGAAKPQVEERVKRENISNIVMLPFQPYGKISEVFSLGDCGLIISKANIGNNSVPSKTWSIMSAGRPILASFDKGFEVDRVITKAKCGICVQADDREALTDAVMKLYQNKNLLIEMGTNGRQYIMENLTRETGTRQWVGVVNMITENSNFHGSDIGES